MAATGEPYTVAARNLGVGSLGVSGPPGAAQDAVRDVIACANRTLTAASARIEARSDADLPQGREWQGRRRPGLIGRLARFAGRAALERVAPGTDPADLLEAFLHQVGEGFVEPAAGRYLIDFGGYAQMLVDGRRFGGRSGAPLGPRHESRGKRRLDDPFDLLRLAQNVTDARYAGAETVRGTPCRLVVATAGLAELTVWIDDQHVRRIQTVERASAASSRRATTSASAPTSASASPTSASAPTAGASTTSTVSGTSKTDTLELWDFGVPVDSLDWSRLPAFRAVQ